MKRVRPGRLVHRGSVTASGFLFDGATIGGARVRERILRLWTPGCIVRRVGERWLLLLASPRRVDTTSSPGVPLVEVDGAFFSAPLTAGERSQVGPVPGSVVVVRAAEVRTIEPGASVADDPARWIDLDEVTLVEMTPLGSVTAPPLRVESSRPFDARARFEGVPDAAPQLEAIIAGIRRRGGKRPTGRVLAALGSAIWALANALPFRRRTAKRAGRSPAPGAVRTVQRRWNLPARIRRWAERIVSITRLTRLLGGRQARFVANTLAMFERGDLDEALRHAIPLGAAEGMVDDGPAFGLPGRRRNLNISPARGPGRSSLIGGERLHFLLARTYRDAFERLSAQGRVEEAAFVLAELLEASAEAVAYLERHGRLRLAAELAEGRKLEPGLVVRQWIIAGDVDRAVMLAGLTGAFSDALILLEKTHPEHAELLQVLWANRLAESGEFATAAEIAWPVDKARRLARTWMDLAIDAGGAAGGRTLARKLALVDDPNGEIFQHVLAVLENEDPAQASFRRAFARTLGKNTRTPESRVLARVCVRSVLRDASVDPTSASVWAHLDAIRYAVDGPLVTDTAALRRKIVHVRRDSTLKKRDTPVRHRFEPGDIGASAVKDAVSLPGRRVLVAYGEAGVHLLRADGSVRARFEAPADRLVVADNGNRAIALARRGESWRLTKLDLARRIASEWTDARFSTFAESYDGSLWFVAREDALFGIDATAPDLRAVWNVDEVGGAICHIVRSEKNLCFAALGETYECWRYELRTMLLRSREEIDVDPVYVRPSCLGISEAGTPTARLSREGCLSILPLFGVDAEWAAAPDLVPMALKLSGSWVALSFRRDGGILVYVLDVAQQRPRLEIELLGSRRVTMRLDDEELTVCDDRGRVLTWELDQGLLVRDLRLP